MGKYWCRHRSKNCLKCPTTFQDWCCLNVCFEQGSNTVQWQHLHQMLSIVPILLQYYCMLATLLEFCHSHISTYVHMSCAHLFKTTFPIFPIFPSTSTFNSNISAFSGCEGRLARSLGLCIHSRECQNLILIVELQFCNFSLSLSAVFLFQLLCLYVSA